MKINISAVLLLLGLSMVIVSCGRNHKYVDLGLPSGTLWATCNIGAKTPTESGNLFAWGETEPKKEFYEETYKFYSDSKLNEYQQIDELKISKYNTREKYGRVDEKTILDLKDDAANIRWGGSWRIPSDEEWTELRKECKWEWQELDDEHKGYVVTGPNGNSIFIPAICSSEDNGLNTDQFGINDGYYWSSSLYNGFSCFARFVFFNSNNVYSNIYYRYKGLCIRPVIDSPKKQEKQKQIDSEGVIYEEYQLSNKTSNKSLPIDPIKAQFQMEEILDHRPYTTKRFQQFSYYQTELDVIYDTQDGFFPNDPPTIEKDSESDFIFHVSWKQYEHNEHKNRIFLVAKENGEWKIDNVLFPSRGSKKYQVLFDYSRPVQNNLAYDKEEYEFTEKRIADIKSVPEFVPDIPKNVYKNTSKSLPIDPIKAQFQMEEVLDHRPYTTKRFQQFSYYQTDLDVIYDTQDGFFPDEPPTIEKDSESDYIFHVSWKQYQSEHKNRIFLVAKENGRWKIDNILYFSHNSSTKYRVLFDYSRPIQDNLAYGEEVYRFTKKSLAESKSVPDFVPDIPSFE